MSCLKRVLKTLNTVPTPEESRRVMFPFGLVLTGLGFAAFGWWAFGGGLLACAATVALLVVGMGLSMANQPEPKK